MKSIIREATNIEKITLIKQNNITKLWDHYVPIISAEHLLNNNDTNVLTTNV